jgi:Fe-S-cluster containining protein
LKPLAELQRALHEETDRALAHTFAEAEARAGKAYACRAGCNACCHQLVLCTAAEALLIADHLRATRNGPELQVWRRKLEDQSDAAAGLGFFGYSRKRIACAFLDATGACTIYPIRPMACRALKSFSAAACEHVPESPHDLSSSRIPGCGPGLRTAQAVGARQYRMLADQGGLDQRDFTLVLSRAVGLALAASESGGLPSFAAARCKKHEADSNR